MEDRDTKDTYIKDSNVEILIATGNPTGLSGKKKTDYWPMAIIALVMIGGAAYGALKKLGIF